MGPVWSARVPFLPFLGYRLVLGGINFSIFAEGLLFLFRSGRVSIHFPVFGARRAFAAALSNRHRLRYLGRRIHTVRRCGLSARIGSSRDGTAGERGKRSVVFKMEAYVPLPNP